MRNEALFVAACIPSILRQDDHRIAEVLLIDGESTDGTRDALPPILNGLGYLPCGAGDKGWVSGASWRRETRTVRLIENRDRHVAQALNLGIRESTGNVLVRMDAHSAYAPDYVRRCVDGLLASGADNYGGVAETVPADQGVAARTIAAVTSHPLGVGGSRFRTGSLAPLRVDTVPFGSFHRDLFDRIGLFDERLVRNQDNEFNARIRRNGGAIVMDPTISFRYYNQSRVGGLVRQGWRTGRWNSLTLRHCPHAFRWRYVVPGLFVAAEMVSVLLLLAGLWTRSFPLVGLGAVVPAAYLAAWVAAAPGIARRHGWVVAAAAPGVALAYHNAYGAGILWGACEAWTTRRAAATGSAGK